jgi:RimJ/RimL family protein N-acetyltransferase
MNAISLRPGDPDRDFHQLAAWFTIIEESENTEQGLREYFEKKKAHILQKVAVDQAGTLQGFHWVSLGVPGSAEISLYVDPPHRRRGIGSRLYLDAERCAIDAGAKKLQVSLRDDDPASLAFAEKRGYVVWRHVLAFTLDLETFNGQPYDDLIARLEGEGFRFTGMEELGDTEADQRKLYALNDKTGMDIPDMDGQHSWATFEDFRESVCRASWYRPGGQMVVIDTATGDWAAMSAISRFGDHAYNLHTGVDRRYRGRKLAQAVKVKALRYARQVLKVKQVRTHHYVRNHPIIAIDRKFGYVQVPGSYKLRKAIAQPTGSN